MDFFKNFLKLVNQFFEKYDYNYFLWYLHDSYIPSQITGITEASFYNIYSFFEFVFNTFCIVNNFFHTLIITSELLLSLGFSTVMLNALFISIKFLVCIALLIFARGGIPRFRFDYLTKLGWIKFLSLVLLSFLIEILILSMA